MTTIQQLLNKAFSLMALSGLALAGWGLIVSPDEIQGERDVVSWGARPLTDHISSEAN
jgi:hypothetical protein